MAPLTASDAKTDANTARIQTLHLHLAGGVQGVGFRPHVYRTATQLGIDGWVRNQRGEVEIVASGLAGNIDLFKRRLLADAPKTSTPKIVLHQLVETPTMPYSGFSIIDSMADDNNNIHLPLDLDCCQHCHNELKDPHSWRYRYPFISCTQCGPRYTAMMQLPYDRINTNMNEFPPCARCEKEYNDPDDRRFHAESISCPECGPQLTFVEKENRHSDSVTALQQTHAALLAGKIVAVKGVGGYHLLCEADNDDAIARLRTRKGRADKPLAVMFSSLDAARHALIIDEVTAAHLCDRSHPIVLCQKRAKSTLSTLIAPGLNHIGALLPYSPLHHLILNDFGKPVIATSGNISGEPVLTEADETERRLGEIADAFLHHNRTITHTADDSLFQIINHRPHPLRLGRGHTPLELSLPFTIDKPLLAVGGQMKNTIALAWENRIVISPHIGELGSPRTAELFKQTIESLQSHYHVIAEGVVCDAHPNYYSRRWAEACGLKLTQVYHHHAHAAAISGEYNLQGNSLIFTWDGAGLGTDGTLWGGETLFGRPGQWQRVATMRPFLLPGGERAAREPWRCAAALCWQAGEQWEAHPQAARLFNAWQKRINTPQTSSIGRFFDGAASLLGLIDHATFEGQAAMLLQAAAETSDTDKSAPLPHSFNDEGIMVCDWQPLLCSLRDQQKSTAQRARHFHSTLAHTLCDQAVQLRQRHGPFTVGLSGGVFQNRLLTEQAMHLLEIAGFEVYLPQRLPCNDAALCYGQIIEAATPR